jgi:hypothetical protein
MTVERSDQGCDTVDDGMRSRPIRGTTDWTRYEIVLDVPRAAPFISFGVSLVGGGHVWFDDFRFDAVDASVPTTEEPPLPCAVCPDLPY